MKSMSRRSGSGYTGLNVVPVAHFRNGEYDESSTPSAIHKHYGMASMTGLVPLAPFTTLSDVPRCRYRTDFRRMEKEMNERAINGLLLFKSLIKDGCVWDGDTMSTKWSECLDVPTDIVEMRARETLALGQYVEGTDYKWQGNHSIWIA